MDILESVLRTSNAEAFLEIFRNQGVDASILPILNDDDLILLGVEDSKIRNKIMKQASTLQIHAEKNIDCTITKEYVQLVLSQILAQLTLHQANLACALRNDVVVCDMKLTNGVKCLNFCIDSCENQLNKLYIKIKPQKRKKDSKKWFKIACATASATIILILGLKYSN